ncbi:hypothetical protein BaRGS_00033770, partial [Batillaria attramentaria]
PERGTPFCGRSHALAGLDFAADRSGARRSVAGVMHWLDLILRQTGAGHAVVWPEKGVHGLGAYYFMEDSVCRGPWPQLRQVKHDHNEKKLGK